MYLISGVVTVNSGVTLTIQPGTIIKFQNNGTVKGKLTLNGVILAQGNSTNKIVFTSIHDDSYGGDSNNNGNATRPSAGDWDNVSIASTGSGSAFGYTLLQYGGSATAVLSISGASVNLSDSTVRWSLVDGVNWLSGASGTIARNLINNNVRYGISLVSASMPTITDNTIFHNRSYAVYMEGSSPANFEGNIVFGNTYNGIGVYSTLASGTWHENLPYIVTTNLTLESSNTLTLEPGTVVKFLANTNLIIRGTLVADGTQDDRIIFTSIKDDFFGGDTQQDGAATKPLPGNWGTIYFGDTSNDSGSRINHVLIQYAGTSYNYGTGTVTAGLSFDSASTSIQNTIISKSSGYGLQLINASSPLVANSTFVDNLNHGAWLSAASSPTFNDNIFARNAGYAVYQSASSQAIYSGNIAAGNKTNGIGVTGSLSSNVTWGNNLPYVVEGTINLTINTTLTIQPDSVIKFASGAGLLIDGWLIAQGTEGHPVFFTSIKDDAIGGDTNADGFSTSPAAGNWVQIRFTSTSGNSILDQVVVRYGGSNTATGALFFDGGAPGTISHLTVMGSQYRGLYCMDSSPYIESSNFSANALWYL